MSGQNLSPYLRLITKTGNTRHPGGLKATEALLSRSDIGKKSRVLDIGCGAGHSSAAIAKKFGAQVFGIDISRDAVEQAADIYKKESYFDLLKFEEGDISHLRFSDGFFDVVVCESVLLFVKDKSEGLTEISRVLKPGGYFLLNELCLNDGAAKSLRKYFSHQDFGGYLESEQYFLKSLAELEFSVVVEDHQDFDIKEHLKAEVLDLFGSKNIFHFLELIHRTAINKDMRDDLFRVARFLLKLPKGALGQLKTLKVLGQKKAAPKGGS